MKTPKKANAGAYLAAAGQAKEVAPKSVDALDERIANVVAGPKYSDEKLFAEKGAMIKGLDASKVENAIEEHLSKRKINFEELNWGMEYPKDEKQNFAIWSFDKEYTLKDIKRVANALGKKYSISTKSIKGKDVYHLQHSDRKDSNIKIYTVTLDLKADNKMSNGGTTTIDDSGSNVPSDLVDVFNQFDEDADSYGEMERLRLKANDLGYDFDYDLGGGPTEFWKLKNGGYILKQSHLSSAQYQDAKKLKNFDKKDYTWNVTTKLYDKSVRKMNGGYIESMGDDFNKGIERISMAFQKWYDGPMTELEDVGLAIDDIAEYIKTKLISEISIIDIYALEPQGSFDDISKVTKRLSKNREYEFQVNDEQGNGWRIQAPYLKNLIVYATPFWNDEPGTTIVIRDENDNVLYEHFLPFDYKQPMLSLQDLYKYYRLTVIPVISEYLQKATRDYAKGGMTEHGLQLGDKIIGAGKNSINVVTKKGGQKKVDLSEGTRESFAKGGSTYADGGLIVSWFDKDINYQSKRFDTKKMEDAKRFFYQKQSEYLKPTLTTYDNDVILDSTYAEGGRVKYVLNGFEESIGYIMGSGNGVEVSREGSREDGDLVIYFVTPDNEYAEGGKTHTMPDGSTMLNSEHYENGGTIYEFSYRDEEGDLYEDAFDSLKEAKDTIKEYRKQGYNIIETWIYKDNEFKGRFEDGGKTQTMLGNKLSEKYPEFKETIKFAGDTLTLFTVFTEKNKNWDNEAQKMIDNEKRKGRRAAVIHKGKNHGLYLKAQFDKGGYIVGSEVLYKSGRNKDEVRGQILKVLDDNEYAIATGFSQSLVSKDDIIGKAPDKKWYQFEDGGETWAQKSVEKMEEKGTVGLFTKKAKKAGMSTTAYAKKVLNKKNEKRYGLKTRQQAQWMKNMNPELFKS